MLQGMAGIHLQAWECHPETGTHVSPTFSGSFATLGQESYIFLA